MIADNRDIVLQKAAYLQPAKGVRVIRRMLRHLVHRPSRKFWETTENRIDGVIVGVVTLFDDEMEWHGYEDGRWAIVARMPIRAFRLSPGWNRKPVLVDYCDVMGQIESTTKEEAKP